MRFADAAELLELTGLVPGSVPPFGPPVLPLELWADPALCEQPKDRLQCRLADDLDRDGRRPTIAACAGPAGWRSRRPASVAACDRLCSRRIVVSTDAMESRYLSGQVLFDAINILAGCQDAAALATRIACSSPV